MRLVRLADFLRAHRGSILAEWEAYARVVAPVGGSMDVAALRDHAGQMLDAFADDLGVAQTAAAQAEKAQGWTAAAHARRSAAGAHGAGRAASGFTVAEMTAEFRALRASVVRLWAAAQGLVLRDADLDDLTRFHEAIDQALAESVVQFEAQVEQAKELFLAILGHDLRTPLDAIQTSATFLLDTEAVAPAGRPLAAQIAGSARRAVVMVGELLDFTRSRLGGGIPVVRAEAHLFALVRDVAAEVAAAHPDRVITVRASADERRVRLSVDDQGAGVPRDERARVWEPFRRGRAAEASAQGGSGIGLAVVRELALQYGGDVGVEDAPGGGARFVACFPRADRRAGEHLDRRPGR